MRKERSEGGGWKSVVEGIGDEKNIVSDARYHVVENYESFKSMVGVGRVYVIFLDIWFRLIAAIYVPVLGTLGLACIAGPCLASWLAKTRLDISITVIERSPSPRVTGQAIDIRGPAVENNQENGNGRGHPLSPYDRRRYNIYGFVRQNLCSTRCWRHFHRWLWNLESKLVTAFSWKPPRVWALSSTYTEIPSDLSNRQIKISTWPLLKNQKTHLT